MPCVTGTLSELHNRHDGSTYGILIGYSTGIGYDCDGTRIVDIANLVKRRQSVSFTPSTTALTLNSAQR